MLAARLPERAGAAGAALVEDHNPPMRRVEEAPMHDARPRPRPAMQEQHRPPTRIADLLPVHDVTARERQVTGLERPYVREEVTARHTINLSQAWHWATNEAGGLPRKKASGSFLQRRTKKLLPNKSHQPEPVRECARVSQLARVFASTEAERPPGREHRSAAKARQMTALVALSNGLSGVAGGGG